MTIEKTITAAAATLKIVGRLDTSTVPALEAPLRLDTRNPGQIYCR